MLQSLSSPTEWSVSCIQPMGSFNVWRRPWIWIACIGILFVIAILVAPRSPEKTSALGTICSQFLRADYNRIQVLECGNLALNATHNLSVIKGAAGYLAILGSNTKVYLEIARLAEASDTECEHLGEVLDLAVMKQSESQSIIALAKTVCAISSPDAEEAWQEQYDYLRSRAEYSSVESALAAMRKH